MGGNVPGGLCPGEYWNGGILSRGDIVRGDIGMGGYCPDTSEMIDLGIATLSQKLRMLHRKHLAANKPSKMLCK